MQYDIILFTDYPFRHYFMRPLGAYRIASELRSHGYTVKVLHSCSRWFHMRDKLNELMDQIVGPNTLFIGFSSTFFNHGKLYFEKTSRAVGIYSTSLEVFNDFCYGLKQKHPQLKIVYGGSKANFERDLSQAIDYVVVGLSDAQVVVLANHLRDGSPIQFNKLAGLGRKYKIVDYDKLGKDHSIVTSETIYTPDDFVLRGETLALETSRGCMFNCAFCTFPLLGRKKTDPAYHKSLETLTSELKRNWEEHGVRKYSIVDNTFNETTGKLELVGRAAEKAGVDLEFGAYLRLDLFTAFPEQIKMLRDIGLRAATFGVETLNDPSAKAVGKGLPSEKVKEIMYQCREAWGKEVSMSTGMIVGLPYETPETLEKGLRWIIGKDSPFDLVQYTGLGLNYWYEEPSRFTQDPGKWGYTVFPDRTWKNETWDARRCQEIALAINKHALETGFNKVATFGIMAFQSFGLEYHALRDKPYKDLPYGAFEKALDKHFKQYVAQTFEYEKINAPVAHTNRHSYSAQNRGL